MLQEEWVTLVLLVSRDSLARMGLREPRDSLARWGLRERQVYLVSVV